MRARSMVLGMCLVSWIERRLNRTKVTPVGGNQTSRVKCGKPVVGVESQAVSVD